MRGGEERDGRAGLRSSALSSSVGEESRFDSAGRWRNANVMLTALPVGCHSMPLGVLARARSSFPLTPSRTSRRLRLHWARPPRSTWLRASGSPRGSPSPNQSSRQGWRGEKRKKTEGERARAREERARKRERERNAAECAVSNRLAEERCHGIVPCGRSLVAGVISVVCLT